MHVTFIMFCVVM